MLTPAHTIISVSSCPTVPRSSGKQLRKSRVLPSSPSNGMDSRRRSAETEYDRQRLQARQSSPALQQSSNRSPIRPTPHSNPLPQSQWSGVPLPYRPRNWSSLEEDPVPVVRLDSTSARNPSSTPLATSEADYDQFMAASARSQRHRERAIRKLSSPRNDMTSNGPMDVSRLHPQIRPYNDRLSTISAPDELEFHYARSVSQPSVPQATGAHNIYDLPSLGIPRTPTYPPTGRRRIHSATGVTDAAFADEHEFRLFVEATSSLTLHPQPELPAHSSQRRRPGYDDPPPLTRPVTTGDIGSPVQETPTTMYALRQLAQLPQTSHQWPGQRMQTSASGGDLWLQPPAVSMLAHSEAILGDVDQEDFDDELPDYAESQAQAQAHQRVEAARRAQELQQRWQQSGARRGL